MQRLLSFAFAALFVGVFALPVLADSGSGMSGVSKRQACPTGQMWVKGYKKKNGSLVKGYCRKAAAAKTGGK
jgi:hypothetical protein